MALDRTWYNSLVDDDGSGLTGSVWDKADVNQLMNAIDNEFGRLLTWGAWTPALTTPSGGTPIYTTQSGIYAVAGTLVQVAGQIVISSKGSLPAGQSLRIAGLPRAPHATVGQSGIVGGYFAGLALNVTGIWGYTDAGGAAINLMFGNAPGVSYSQNLLTDHISAGFTLIYGGTYRTN